MSITEIYTPSGGADHPDPGSQLLQFRDGTRPESGPDTIAEVHLQNALSLPYEPLPEHQVVTAAISKLTEAGAKNPYSGERDTTGRRPNVHSIVTRGLTRANPQLRERELSMPGRIRSAAAAVQSLHYRRQPISELNEHTVLAGLNFLEAQVPQEAAEKLDENTNALIEGYGYVAATAVQTEHFALAQFATGRIDHLTSKLRGPEPDTAPSKAYLEAMAILHSSLATRAYALLRMYGEQFAEYGAADNELLLQARKDEGQIIEHLIGRSSTTPIGPRHDRKYVKFLPKANSGYTAWDVRTMRYAMGYHFMDGTLDRITTGPDVRDFLEAVTSDNVASTTPTTVAIPLLGYLSDPKVQALRNRILTPMPKSTEEALQHEKEQEQKARRLLLRSRH